MATWVRSGTGTAPSSTDANLSGRYALDTATAPGDFDAAGVTAVQIAYTITGASFSDDDWHNLRAATLDDATNTGATVDGTDAVDLQNEASTTDETDSSPNTGLTTANWEAMAVSGGAGINGTYTFFDQNMKADGGTQTMSALTVTITYTPAAGTDEIAGDAEAAAETTADLTLLIKPSGDAEAAVEVESTPKQTHAGVALSEAAAETSGGSNQTQSLSGTVEASAEAVATPIQIHKLGCPAAGGGFSSGFSSGFDVGGGSGSCVEAAAEVTAALTIANDLIGAAEAAAETSGALTLVTGVVEVTGTVEVAAETTASLLEVERITGAVEAAAEVDGSTLTVTGVTTDFVGWGIPAGVS